MAGTCCNDILQGLKTCVVHFLRSVAGTFCPRDMSHRVQFVEFHGTCRGYKISPKLV